MHAIYRLISSSSLYASDVALPSILLLLSVSCHFVIVQQADSHKHSITSKLCKPFHQGVSVGHKEEHTQMRKTKSLSS